MPKPVAKANLIHQLLLGALVAPHPHQKLARNVSWANVDRAATRWAA